MKRKLLKQICHEWRSNLWLAVELLIVSVAMWYIADFLSVQAVTLNEEMGLDTENCYLISYGRVPADSPDFDTSDSTATTYRDNFAGFVDRLTNYPDIEQSALCTHLGVPYMQNSWNLNLSGREGADTFYVVSPSLRQVSPDYIRLFRIKGAKGETSEQLAQTLESGKIIFSSNVLKIDEFTQEAVIRAIHNRHNNDPYDLLNKRLLCPDISPSDSLTVGGIMVPVKRIEYEHPGNNLLLRLDPGDYANIRAAIIVRVKAACVKGFEERLLADSEDKLRTGNFFISDVMPLTTIRDITQADYRDSVINHLVVMFFLLASIFLGLLGTFWFRTQQRVSEIAIRKVNGASSAMIMRRLLGEGLLLLALVTPAAVGGDWLLCHFGFNTPIDWYGTPVSMSRILLTALMVFVVMALMIALGIWFPAKRAMHVDAATALKDE